MIGNGPLPMPLRLQIAKTSSNFARVGPESRIAIDCANYLRARLVERGDVPPWTHVPNEGKRSVQAAQKLIAEGLTTGFPDNVFLAPGTLVVELKAGRGKQSDAQERVQAWCEGFGVQYELVRSRERFIEIYEQWHSKTIAATA